MTHGQWGGDVMLSSGTDNPVEARPNPTSVLQHLPSLGRAQQDHPRQMISVVVSAGAARGAFPRVIADARPIGDTAATMARAKVLARARQWQDVKDSAQELFDKSYAFHIGPTMGRLWALDRARGTFHCALVELVFRPP